MDELAHAAGKDPYAFRAALLGKQPRFKRVLDAAAEKAGWGKAPAGHHQGIALMEGYGTYMAQVVEVSRPCPANPAVTDRSRTRRGKTDGPRRYGNVMARSRSEAVL